MARWRPSGRLIGRGRLPVCSASCACDDTEFKAEVSRPGDAMGSAECETWRVAVCAPEMSQEGYFCGVGKGSAVIGALLVPGRGTWAAAGGEVACGVTIPP